MNDPFESGNDSFLDIIANLVGILVILVVATAVRVANSPKSSEEPIAAAVVEPLPLEIDVSPEAMPEPVVASSLPAELALTPTDRPGPRTPFDPPIDVYLAADDAPPPIVLPEPTVDPRLLAELRDAERAVESLPQAVGVTDLTRRLALLKQIDPISPDGDLVDELSGTISERQIELTALQSKLGEAKTRLAAVELADDATETLVHEIRPVARMVGPGDRQVLLYVRDGHVALIPLEELTREVARSYRRRAPQGFIGNVLQGEVGPIGGFEAVYRYRRGGSSPIDDLLSGGYGGNMQVKVFLVPTERPIGVPVADAVGPGSRLRDLLSDDRVVLTMMTYPDSFAASRQLEQLARRAGVRVAVRPQHEGLPVVYSTEGSRSMSQ